MLLSRIDGAYGVSVDVLRPHHQASGTGIRARDRRVLDRHVLDMPQGNTHRALPTSDYLDVLDGHVGGGHAHAARNEQAVKHRTGADHGHEPAVVVIPARSARDLPGHLPQLGPSRDTRAGGVREAAPMRSPCAMREQVTRPITHGCSSGGRFMHIGPGRRERGYQEPGGEQGENSQNRRTAVRALSVTSHVLVDSPGGTDIREECNRPPYSELQARARVDR